MRRKAQSSCTASFQRLSQGFQGLTVIKLHRKAQSSTCPTSCVTLLPLHTHPSTPGSLHTQVTASRCTCPRRV